MTRPQTKPMIEATSLVDLEDPTAQALAIAPCESLPDITGVLVLADRLQELGDQRERRVRRCAHLVTTRPGEVRRFGERSARTAFRATPGQYATLSAFLMMKWVAERDGSFTRPVKLAALVAMGLAKCDRESRHTVEAMNPPKEALPPATCTLPLA